MVRRSLVVVMLCACAKPPPPTQPVPLPPSANSATAASTTSAAPAPTVDVYAETQKQHEAWCASDRVERLARRNAERQAREAKEATVAVESERAKRRAEFLRTKCKKTERAVRGPSAEVCVDDDGFLRECEGIVAVDVTYLCPPNGPDGLSGVVRAMHRPNDNHARRAMGDDALARMRASPMPGAAAPLPPPTSKDDLCRTQDEAAVSTSP